MKIEQLTSIYKKKIPKETIKFSKKTWLWCKLPYPNHPNGCPNYNKSDICPPHVKYMDNLTQIYNHFYIIYAIFNLERQRKRMLRKHPNWSIRQANCLLYWQGSVKKQLKKCILKIYERNKEKNLFLLSCGSGFKLKEFKQKQIPSMEAVGIDVLDTMKNNHINFELKPMNKVILSNLICSNEELLIE